MDYTLFMEIYQSVNNLTKVVGSFGLTKILFLAHYVE